MRLCPRARPLDTANGRTSLVAALLGILVAVGPVSTDIYLPAFPRSCRPN